MRPQTPKSAAVEQLHFRSDEDIGIMWSAAHFLSRRKDLTIDGT